MIYDLVKELTRFLWQDELGERDELRSQRDSFKSKHDELLTFYQNLSHEVKTKLSIIQELQKKLDSVIKWDNPYNWKKYTGSFTTIDGLSIPANTFIDDEDADIKRLARNMTLGSVEEDANKAESYYHRKIAYYYDFKNPWHPDYVEVFQTASFTFRSKKGDCEDMAILFQSHMHNLSYGDKVITCTGMVEWHNGEEIGHCWNKVLIDDEWVDYDVNAGSKKKDVVYPELKDCWFWFNKYGNYQS